MALGVPVVLLSVDTLETLPGSSASGSGLLVRLRDPEAERKIGRELQTADRLAAISRVSGGVAHEVKNPLNAILLHVEVAKAKLARGDTDVEKSMRVLRYKSAKYSVERPLHLGASLAGAPPRTLEELSARHFSVADVGKELRDRVGHGRSPVEEGRALTCASRSNNANRAPAGGVANRPKQWK